MLDEPLALHHVFLVNSMGFVMQSFGYPLLRFLAICFDLRCSSYYKSLLQVQMLHDICVVAATVVIIKAYCKFRCCMTFVLLLQQQLI